jgi:hypothetical protein
MSTPEPDRVAKIEPLAGVKLNVCPPPMKSPGSLRKSICVSAKQAWPTIEAMTNRVLAHHLAILFVLRSARTFNTPLLLS